MGISVVEVYSEPLIIEVIEPEGTVEVATTEKTRVVEVGIGGFVPDLSSFAKLVDLAKFIEMPQNEIWEIDPADATSGTINLLIMNMYNSFQDLNISLPMDASAIQADVDLLNFPKDPTYVTAADDAGITVSEVDGRIRFEYTGLHSRWRRPSSNYGIPLEDPVVLSIQSNSTDGTPTVERVQEGHGLEIDGLVMDAAAIYYFWDRHLQLGYLTGAHPNLQSMIDSFDDLLTQSGLWDNGQWQGLSNPPFDFALVTQTGTTVLGDGILTNAPNGTQVDDVSGVFPQSGKGSLGSAGWAPVNVGRYRFRGHVNIRGLAAGTLVEVFRHANATTQEVIGQHVVSADEATFAAAADLRIPFESEPIAVAGTGNASGGRLFQIKATGSAGTLTGYRWELEYLGP